MTVLWFSQYVIRVDDKWHVRKMQKKCHDFLFVRFWVANLAPKHYGSYELSGLLYLVVL